MPLQPQSPRYMKVGSSAAHQQGTVKVDQVAMAVDVECYFQHFFEVVGQ